MFTVKNSESPGCYGFQKPTVQKAILDLQDERRKLSKKNYNQTNLK